MHVEYECSELSDTVSLRQLVYYVDNFGTFLPPPTQSQPISMVLNSHLLLGLVRTILSEHCT